MLRKEIRCYLISLIRVSEDDVRVYFAGAAEVVLLGSLDLSKRFRRVVAVRIYFLEKQGINMELTGHSEPEDKALIVLEEVLELALKEWACCRVPLLCTVVPELDVCAGKILLVES